MPRLPKYVIVFPETPNAPAVPPDDLVREVQDLVRRSMELGRLPAELDPELARYMRLDSFDPDYIEAWRLGRPLPRSSDSGLALRSAQREGESWQHSP